MPKVVDDQKSESLMIDGFVLDGSDGSTAIFFNLSDGDEKGDNRLDSSIPEVSR